MKLKPILLEINDNNPSMKGDIILVDNFLTIAEIDDIGNKNFNIYLINPEVEIKEGDWYIDDCGEVRKSITSDKEYWSRRKDYNKIIASTDSSLITGYTVDFNSKEIYFPQLSEQAIKLLIDYYNKNGCMPEFIEVETGGNHLEFLEYCSNNGFSYDESFGWYETLYPGHRPNTSTLEEMFNKKILKIGLKLIKKNKDAQVVELVDTLEKIKNEKGHNRKKRRDPSMN